MLLGYIPMISMLPKTFTVLELVQHFLTVKGSKLSVDSVLWALDAFDCSQRDFSHLGKSMQRRIALGIALIGNPSTLLLGTF